MVTMIITKTLVASVVEEAVAEDLVAEGAVLALLMTMKMKTLEVDLAAEVAAVEDLVTEEGEALALQMTTIMVVRILVDLAAEEDAVAALAAREVDLVLQMMTMKTQEDSVKEAVEALEGAEEEDLDPAVMTERKTQVAVALAQGEEALEGLNHPVMVILKDLAAEEVALGEMTMVTMMKGHVDGGVVEVEGGGVAPEAVTMMMATSTLQSLVVRFTY